MYQIILVSGELVCDNIPCKTFAWRLGKFFGKCLVVKDGGIHYDFSEGNQENSNLIYLLECGYNFDYKNVSVSSNGKGRYIVEYNNKNKFESTYYSDPESAIKEYLKLKEKYYGSKSI